MSDIIWTKTDEAPLFASYSLFPIIKSFLSRAGISITRADISLAGRILSLFSKELGLNKADELELLGELTAHKEANIIKLPNISATLVQLKAAISELRSKGINVPFYPDEIVTDYDEEVAKKYQKVLGSAVNPVLRQGNSDRRVLPPVKEFAKKHPHSNGSWDKANKTKICYMQKGDFYENEHSIIASKDEKFYINFISSDGKKELLKELAIQSGEVVDAAYLSVNELDKFYESCFETALKENLTLSLHLKCTMMKVSDPVIFAHAIKSYFKEVFELFGDEFKASGVEAKNGLKDMFYKISTLKNKDEILSKKAKIWALNENASNFDVPNDVIIDASVPALIRNSGKVKDRSGELNFSLCMIPDRTYARVYEACVADFKEHGALDVSKIGSVANVGLMAKKAEEYGSHDKTFVAKEDGEFVVFDEAGESVFAFSVKSGDIFRMTQAKDDAINAWFELALKRGEISKDELIFWLDSSRAHDRNLIAKFEKFKEKFTNAGVKFEILNYEQATLRSLEMIRAGKDVIGVTGNVLRDYLTDLFPIFELGGSSKMLSVVPLLAGGAMFETGAGGTAPTLVKELKEKNHLLWDSLGEFLALSASLEYLAFFKQKKEAKELSEALNRAVASYLDENKTPNATLDTRESHFYLALFWAREMAKSGGILSAIFANLADELEKNEGEILKQIRENDGASAEFGGYYLPDEAKANEVMRPSEILNKIIG
ncbi:NADP-dependent isocitrate dehydrogenase [uncultured Campylobacter sp.]|mgnify:CR=1 FL=1|uniref:NADP-dependent isocitrate dehydrogenase n=1 Tax=uncultured Campylobacter sp. TaxID=218934 RepID=UPI0026219238|nr:NADP-dependent isocitrate dehydrogenase [uncultured Campylobacter sp.]